FVIIGLTTLILLLGLLLRTWRIIREGMQIAFDGYHFQKIAKGIFFEGWYDFSEITRDPPGIFFILVIAENLLGLSGQPLMWSIFIFPQIVCTLQLIIFYILAKRLTKSRMISLMTMFCMSFLGLIVYRNQNVAPEIFVLGLVPFVVFFAGRYFETNDFRFLFVGLFITFGIILIHHLTSLIVLVLWHILIFYDFIYKKIKKKTNKKRRQLINASVLIAIDILVVLFWQFVLKGYPFDFIKNSTQNLFEGGKLVAIIFTIIGVVLLNTILFSIFFYNFDKKKINTGIIVSIILAALTIFGMAVFFGGSAPDMTIIAILVIGTPAFVLPPLAALGVTKIPKNDESMSRILRGWVFTVVLILSVTVIFP
ncbi:MAG: glycosyltransferase family 39 protein, partial [Candidatus Heimdallarchaeota archaeon]|nr:glycosyltransferase family 39 protein [Candidatus Heimdallarchaeota archaeon]